MAQKRLIKIYRLGFGMIGRKKGEGHPIQEKTEDKAWKQWFQGLSIKDHDDKLRALGLDDEDVEEFNEKFTGDGKKPAQQPANGDEPEEK